MSEKICDCTCYFNINLLNSNRWSVDSPGQRSSKEPTTNDILHNKWEWGKTWIRFYIHSHVQIPDLDKLLCQTVLISMD